MNFIIEFFRQPVSFAFINPYFTINLENDNC